MVEGKGKEREAMNITLEIPDEIAAELMAKGEDLSRRALESLALEELRAGRITEPQLGQILGLGRLEREGFLKAHGIFEPYTLEDFEEERQALKALGF
jgi:hypothetical protein